MFRKLLALLGCERRARENELRVFAWRVKHARTAEDLYDIADEAIHAGLIAEVQNMLDAKELPGHQMVSEGVFRGYWEERETQ